MLMGLLTDCGATRSHGFGDLSPYFGRMFPACSLHRRLILPISPRFSISTNHCSRCSTIFSSFLVVGFFYLIPTFCGRSRKVRRTQYEHLSSALPSNSDIARCGRHFAFVPRDDVNSRGRQLRRPLRCFHHGVHTTVAPAIVSPTAIPLVTACHHAV
jgi:hypothetical protein